MGNLVVRWPWLAIACWSLLAVVLPLSFPSLAEMAEQHPVDILPADAPASTAASRMTEAFGESGSDNVLLVVLTDGDVLGAEDEATYRTLVERLRQDPDDVVMLQDFLTTPPLRDVLVSKDGEAWMLSVGIAGGIGSPESYEAYTRVADIVRETVAESPLTATLTGPAATVADLTDVGQRDLKRIEAAVAVLLVVILLVVYRNPVTMLLPLLGIGVSLVIASAVVAALAAHGLGVSNQTIVLLTAVMAGAGTDYAVFLISRYHDYLRLGAAPLDAVRNAVASMAKVLAASAATVAITFLSLSFARLGLLSTAGVAIAIGIAVSFAAAVTLLPAILALAGPRGWIAPRRDRTARYWRRSSIRIIRRPLIHLGASLVVLAALAGCAMLAHYTYDDRKSLPATSASSVGYAAMAQHFPVNSTIPQYLVIESPQDLRTPQALADLEQMAQRISQLPDIETVRGITRPAGESMEEARATHQAGIAGRQIGGVSAVIRDTTADLNRLTAGADELADKLLDARGQVASAVAGARGLVDALGYFERTFGGDRTLTQIDVAAQLVNGIRALGENIGIDVANIAGSLDWVRPVLRALDTSGICNADIPCTNARRELQRLAATYDSGAFDQIAELARHLQSMQGTQSLEVTLRGLRSTVDAAAAGLRSLGLTDTRSSRTRLTNLQHGADSLAEASRELAEGVRQLVDSTKKMGGGLGALSNFLLTMDKDASTPAMAGFYISPQLIELDDFKKAARLFISPDGRAARYLVQTSLDPFSPEAMNQIQSIVDTARAAQPNTSIADASLSLAGYPTTLRDIRDYYHRDLRFIIFATIAVVLVILTALLRSIVAPLYLVGSVVLSYLSALGLGVLVFQFLMGQQLHWSVPGLAFILLVAVGADYNMLLISRLREESSHGVRYGIIRTVGSTGGVITAAGAIFAASMFGLLFSGISTLVQVGFVVGIGLLLDTFLVRTITVPAAAALLGRANWWPSRPNTAATSSRVKMTISNSVVAEEL